MSGTARSAPSGSPGDTPSASSRLRGDGPYVAAAAMGAALVGTIGRRYGLDRTTCASWPSALENAAWAATYLGAVALLSFGWLGLVRRRGQAGSAGLGATVGWGVLVHVCALVGPPFLSLDPVCYAAIGRAMARFGASAAQPLKDALPPGDPFLQLLPPHWQARGSVYWAGFNELARAIALVAREDLGAHLRLYQLSGMLAMILAGAIAGAAAGSRAAALVLFCPLAVIEGTQSAHNDAWMAVGTAGFAWAIGRGRKGAGAVSLASALAVKASAALLVGWHVLVLVFARFSRWLERRAQRLGALAAVLAAVATLVVLVRTVPALEKFSLLIGSPNDPYDYCTRSIECLPRILLRWVLHAPAASWAVGLSFRAAGAVWLGYTALRASRDGHTRTWMATALFVYYLYLHGWAQSWYLLPLLPLLPWAEPRLRRAMLTLCVTAVAYYALVIPLNCVRAPVGIAIGDLLEAIITIVPPSVVALRERRAEAA